MIIFRHFLITFIKRHKILLIKSQYLIMFICFLCKIQNLNLNSYIIHLKRHHGCTFNSKFVCIIENCLQTFSNLSSFKRHLNRHKLICNKIENLDSKNAQTIVDETLENTSNFSEQNNLNNEIPTLSNCYNTVSPNLLNKSSPSPDNINNKSVISPAALFLLSLHSRCNFTRNDVLFIQKSLIMLFNNIPRDEFIESFNSTTFDIFESLDSEYKLFKYLSGKNLYSTAFKFSVDKEIVEVYRNGIPRLHEKDCNGILFPLQFQFKKFLEKDFNFKTHLNNVRKYENNNEYISHFIQGSLWKTKREMYPNKILVPFFLYVDDFEINNPLGSHGGTHSITGIYYSFPTISSSVKLVDIQIGALIRSCFIKEYGNSLCLNLLITHLTDLEKNGILIHTEDGEFKVYFVLGLILGDNLGLNSVLGFCKGFSSSYYCRFCKSHKSENISLGLELTSKLRTLENYEVDVKINDVSQTGINSESIWNTLPSFHVTENYSCDLMHDLFEGVCHYNISQVLLDFIEKKKYFTLEYLNKIKNTFPYGDTEVGNIFKDIKLIHLKKKRINAAAREMWHLTHFLPLLIGSLVESTDEVWHFFTDFLELMDLLMSPKFNDAMLEQLKLKIESHNLNYVRIFKDPLKPKFHFLTHYPTIIRCSGPLRHLNCFRFEAKHFQLKKYCRNINSRINIALSLCLKFQLKFAFDIVSETEMETTVNALDVIQFTIDSKIIENFGFKLDDLKFYNKVCYKYKTFKKDLYVLKSLPNQIELYKIASILLNNNDLTLPYVVCYKYSVVYLKHFVSYKILSQNESEFILPISYFNSPTLHEYRIDDIKMIRSKNFFDC